MKKIIIALSVLLMSLSVLAKTNVLTNSNSEASLIQGITSNNTGLMVSSANLLGDLKVDNAVVPLMKMLKNSEDEGMRISAAQALVKIGDSRGMFAVKKSS